MKVLVVDSMPGKGKTSWAIQNIVLDSRGERFLYVTPYLDEVDRVIEQCKKYGVEVYVPDAKRGNGSKAEHLKRLMSEGKSVVTTHALFDRIDEECLDIIKGKNYTLYLDEVHEVVKQHSLTDNDLELLLNSNYIQVDDKGKIEWIAEDYEGRFEEFKNLCNLGSLYLYASQIFVWCFPIAIFEAMEKTYILTHHFEGQLQSSYYKFHNVGYQMMYVDKTHEETENKKALYTLIQYKKEYDLKDIRFLSDKIDIYEGNLNYSKGISLSSSWFNKVDKVVLKTVKNNTVNYFKNIVKGKSDENMWTTLKVARPFLKGDSYSKGFVELNARATNKYKHKKNLAYLYNRYLNPIEAGFFRKYGITVNEDIYALSELIQWIFRSRIREGKEINIYVPSLRMRTLLKDYLGK